MHQRRDREQVVGFDKSISAKAVEANNNMKRLGKMANTSNKMDWSKANPVLVSKEEKAEIISYAKEKGINIVDLSKFDGDKLLLKDEIDALSGMIQTYPEATKRKITLTVGNLPDDDLAQTRNRTITINAHALRDKKITEVNIKKAGIFASEKAEHIVVHEFGHILSSVKGNKGIEIAQKAYYNLNKEELTKGQALMYLGEEISAYATEYNGNYERDFERGALKVTKYEEIIPEVLSRHENRANDFTKEFIKLLKEM